MNKEVSFVIFLFALMVFIKCILAGRYWDAIIVMTYGLIQLFEFFIWLGIGKQNITLNYIGILLLCITLSLQPLSIALGAEYFTLSDNKTLSNVNFGLIGLYILIFWGYLIWVSKRFPKRNLIGFKGPSGHMVWEILSKSKPILMILSILYVVTSIIVFSLAKDYLVLGLFVATLLISRIYNTILNSEKSITGSLWCFLAIVLIISFGIFL